MFLHGAQTPSSTPYPHPWLGLPISEVSPEEVQEVSPAYSKKVPNETYKAAAHLVVSGKKRRFSNVNIILAHLGGSTPFLAARVAALSYHMGCPLTPAEIIEDFKSFYYETALSAHETTLTAMVTFVPLNRLLFGTDFPGNCRNCATHCTFDDDLILAASTKTVEWYTENLEKYLANRPLDLANVMRNNALSLFPNLGKTKVDHQVIVDHRPHPSE